MRAWWRHWNLDTPPDEGSVAGAAAPAAAATAPAPASHADIATAERAQSAHAEAHRAEVKRMLESGWAGRVAADWAASLASLEAAFASKGPFDGILGFSNGAAAAFLLACHAAAWPAALRAPRFVMLAGGYVPEPLPRLIPHQLLAAGGAAADGDVAGSTATVGSDRAGGEGAGALAAPLPFASLHMVGSNDPVIDVEDSMALADCFDAGGR